MPWCRGSSAKPSQLVGLHLIRTFLSMAFFVFFLLIYPITYRTNTIPCLDFPVGEGYNPPLSPVPEEPRFPGMNL